MTLPPGLRARLTAGALLLMVLGTGMVLGAALDRGLQARGRDGDVPGSFRRPPGSDSRSRGFDPRRSRPPGEPGDSMPKRPPLIVDQVGLSETQNEQVDSIVMHFMEQMRTLHEEFDREYSSRYRAINRASREAVKSVLTPEQVVVYDSLLNEWQQRRRDRNDDSARVEGRGDPNQR